MLTEPEEIQRIFRMERQAVTIDMTLWTFTGWIGHCHQCDWRSEPQPWYPMIYKLAEGHIESHAKG